METATLGGDELETDQLEATGALAKDRYVGDKTLSNHFDRYVANKCYHRLFLNRYAKFRAKHCQVSKDKRRLVILKDHMPAFTSAIEKFAMDNHKTFAYRKELANIWKLYRYFVTMRNVFIMLRFSSSDAP